MIANPVPTAEEMGEILGLSPDRVKTIREIMAAPVHAKRSADAKTQRKAAARDTTGGRTRRVPAAKN